MLYVKINMAVFFGVGLVPKLTYVPFATLQGPYFVFIEV